MRRYVGTLKAIDSETATVSLEQVQCYGSEGRKGNPDLEIAGTDNIYDGIVFRGSDVKDLTIISPPKENHPPQMPNDPAILGVCNAPPTPSACYDEVSLDVKQLMPMAQKPCGYLQLPSF